MIKELEEYLERRGARYFVTLLMLFYVVGTIIFNIYLRNLGIYDFEFLQLRYMFSGAIFAIISGFFLGIPWGIKKIFEKPIYDSEGQLVVKKKKLLEFFLLVFFLFWTPVYSLYIFPKIPAGFGGAKPTLARFVGNYDDIKDINEIIEYETGAESLPLEILNEKSNLAVGANVKILDRNAKRVWIILTKDLYLSSKSNLAKNLIESGNEVTILDSKYLFTEKPLFVDAGAIKSISFSLYEPPKILTQDDLSVAAYVLAKSESNQSKSEKESSKIVKKIIETESPEKAEKILEAVEKLAKPTTSKLVQETQVDQIKEILEVELDSKFLNFRSQNFEESLRLIDLEKFKGIQKEKRKTLAQKITKTLESEFKKILPSSNFLVFGIDDVNFPRKISQIFQGAENAEEVKNRILAHKESTNSLEIKKFELINAEALNLLEKSSQSKTLENKKLVSELLIDYFSSKAPREKEFWSNSEYLSKGIEDLDFLENTKIALKNADSWEELDENLSHFQNLLNKKSNLLSGSGTSIKE